MNGLLPTQFAERIEEPRTRQDPPKRFWKAIVEARKLRRRDLVAVDEEAYAEPLVTALFLYRRDQPKHRQLVLSALGSSSSLAVWRNLAAAAREAWDCSDATLLGVLAYRADEARERQARPRPPDVALALIKQFKLALNFEAGHLDAPQFVQSALGYLRFLPATFVVPDDPSTMQLEGTATFVLRGTVHGTDNGGSVEDALTEQLPWDRTTWPEDLFNRLLDLLGLPSSNDNV